MKWWRWLEEHSFTIACVCLIVLGVWGSVSTIRSLLEPPYKNYTDAELVQMARRACLEARAAADLEAAQAACRRP